MMTLIILLRMFQLYSFTKCSLYVFNKCLSNSPKFWIVRSKWIGWLMNGPTNGQWHRRNMSVQHYFHLCLSCRACMWCSVIFCYTYYKEPFYNLKEKTLKALVKSSFYTAIARKHARTEEKSAHFLQHRK